MYYSWVKIILISIFSFKRFLFIRIKKGVVFSPTFWMNTVSFGVFIVEQRIKICGLLFIHIAIYVR